MRTRPPPLLLSTREFHKSFTNPINMAITLNKSAERCEELAVASGIIEPNSGPTTLLYDISRNCRKLMDASKYLSDSSGWSEREEAAGEVIVSALAYLSRIKCSNIEQLIRDTIKRKELRV